MKTITIPKRFGYPTAKITANGKEYILKSGEEIAVEDHIAEIIENAIALEPKAVMGEIHDAKAFRMVVTAEEDTNDIKIKLPTSWYDVKVFNVFITFPSVSTAFALNSQIGSLKKSWGEIAANSKNVGANLYAVRHYGTAFAATFTTSAPTPGAARPGDLNATMHIEDTDTITFSSGTTDVLIPAGSTFDIWGVC